VRLLLRRTPRLAFLPEPTRAEPNQVVLRIDPAPGLLLQLSALAEQSWRTVHLDTWFVRELGEPPEPYERLLHAALTGDHQYFARQDSVEETWRIVQPLLDHPPDVRPYPRRSWGPEDADTLVRGHPRWQEPWLPGLPRAGDGIDLRIRLVGVGRLAHGLAALQGRAERAAQRRDRGGQPG
jgi:glucose-6-phosphate 1-dehydrogenase